LPETGTPGSRLRSRPVSGWAGIPGNTGGNRGACRESGRRSGAVRSAAMSCSPEQRKQL